MKYNKIDNIKNVYEIVWEAIDEEIKQSEKSIEKYQNQINKLKDSIDWLNEKLQELEQWRAETLWKRNIKIDEELEKLRKEEIQDTEAINKLLEEKRLIEANATQSELEEERELKEQQVADLEVQKLEEETILQTFTDKKILIDENYAKIRAKIEEDITNKTIIEADKQISKLEQLRQKAIQAAEAMRSAWVNVSIPEWTNTSAWTSSSTSVWQIVVNSNNADPKAVAKQVQQVIVNANKNSNKWSLWLI